MLSAEQILYASADVWFSVQLFNAMWNTRANYKHQLKCIKQTKQFIKQQHKYVNSQHENRNHHHNNQINNHIDQHKYIDNEHQSIDHHSLHVEPAPIHMNNAVHNASNFAAESVNNVDAHVNNDNSHIYNDDESGFKLTELHGWLVGMIDCETKKNKNKNTNKNNNKNCSLNPSNPSSSSISTKSTKLTKSFRAGFQIRKTPLYDNCIIESPEGEFLCACDKKKIEWYLKRKLAILIKQDPITIKLTFTPSGKGQNKYKQRNRIVLIDCKIH
jgi:hypothetical protein